MLARKYRFSLRQDSVFFRQARRIETRSLRIFIQKNQPNTQASVIVPKHVDKRATRRNRYKRILIHTLEKVLPTLPSFHLVVFLKRTPASDSFHQEMYDVLATSSLQQHSLLSRDQVFT